VILNLLWILLWAYLNDVK